MLILLLSIIPIVVGLYYYYTTSPYEQSTNTSVTEDQSHVMNNKKTTNDIEIYDAPTYWITRIVILRCTFFLYSLAFIIAINQFPGLLSRHGILPYKNWLLRVKEQYGGEWGAWSVLKSLLVFIPNEAFQDENPTSLNTSDHSIMEYFNNIYNNVLLMLMSSSSFSSFSLPPSPSFPSPYPQSADDYYLYLCYIGLSLSVFVTIKGACNVPLCVIIFLCYKSIAEVGQRWYHFGWEMQLSEMCFLIMTGWVPFLSLKQYPVHHPPSTIGVISLKWMIFRLILGAGLIKLRGDACWHANLWTKPCMLYHYETQPIPNPLSGIFHHMPLWFHILGTLVNHFVELIAPCLLLVDVFIPSSIFKYGRMCTIIGGLIQIGFQFILIASGNLSFLNYLTIIPSLACFDDSCFLYFRSSSSTFITNLTIQMKLYKQKWTMYGLCRRGYTVMFAIMIVILSIDPVLNLLDQRQSMNQSFNSWGVINTYGAFGSVGKDRYEIIFEGMNPVTKTIEEYEFKCKPGSLSRRPCVIAPYHYRLDWMVWFLGFYSRYDHPAHQEWFTAFVVKLLQGEKTVLHLLDPSSPFTNGIVPSAIRARRYRYTYAPWSWQWPWAWMMNSDGSREWWHRELVDDFSPWLSIKQ